MVVKNILLRVLRVLRVRRVRQARAEAGPRVARVVLALGTDILRHLEPCDEALPESLERLGAPAGE